MRQTLSCTLSCLLLITATITAQEQKLAATLLWSEAFTVGVPHGGSGLRVSALDKAGWQAASSKGVKSFRVRPGGAFAGSPRLWLAAGDLAWAVGALPGGGNRMIGPERACEVLDVLEEKNRLWLAWAGGIVLSRDQGKTWRDSSAGLPATFASVIVKAGDRVFAGTETGLARWDEQGGRFQPCGLAGIALRCLVPHGPHLYIGTFRQGVYRLPLDLSGKPEFLGLAGCSVEGLALHGGTLYAATNRRGLCARGIEPGRIGVKILGPWEPLHKWEVDATAVVVVPAAKKDAPPRIFVGTMGKGVWKSPDGGSTWQEFGLPGGHVSSLALFTEKASPIFAQDRATPKDSPKTTIRKWFMGRRRKAANRTSFYTLKWELTDPQQRPRALRALQEILTAPKGDMFFQFPAIGAYYHCADLLPQNLRELFKNTLLTYAGFRGDTENHLCMWHIALYLTAAKFPEAGPDEWYTGRSSGENMAFARRYLRRWMDNIFRHGQMEFDSPHYAVYFLGPLFLLRDFAPEESMRQGATATINLLLADYAADLFKGIYGGGHSRNPRYNPYAMDQSPISSYAWLYFGTRDYKDLKFTAPIAFAAMSDYQCPPVIKLIANDRQVPVLRFERKQVRNRWRYHGRDLNPPVFKTHYLTPHYSVGSCRGGILQPIQQHTWDAGWRNAAGRARTIFTLHPFMNIVEWSTFFPEDPIRMRLVAKATKGTYFKADKWIAGSPHERIFQDRNTVISFYNVPAGELAPHVDAYLPAPEKKLHRAGAWLAINSAPVYAAIYSTGEAKLSPAPADGTRLRTFARPAAFVTEVSSADKWPSFAAFCQALTKRVPAFDCAGLKLRYRNLAGRELHFQWPAGRTIDGRNQTFPAKKLFAGPWLNSVRGTGVITICHGKKTLTLDLPRILNK